MIADFDRHYVFVGEEKPRFMRAPARVVLGRLVPVYHFWGQLGNGLDADERKRHEAREVMERAKTLALVHGEIRVYTLHATCLPTAFEYDTVSP